MIPALYTATSLFIIAVIATRYVYLSNNAYVFNISFRVQLSNYIPETLFSSQVVTLLDPYNQPLGYNPPPLHL